MQTRRDACLTDNTLSPGACKNNQKFLQGGPGGAVFSKSALPGRRRQNKFNALLIVMLLFYCSLWALDPDKRVDQYLVDQWETADGLPSNSIFSINQTPDGYLWILTSKALVRFDGIKFETISVPGEEKNNSKKTVTLDTLFVDRAGTLWIGSSAGLISYRCKTGQFEIFTASDGLTDDRIRYINEDMKGNIWISFYASYVNRFFNGKFTAFNAASGLEGKKVNAIIEDSKGNLILGTRENGVFKYKEDKFIKYNIPGLDNNHYLITMQEDREDNLWIGTNNGLFKVINHNSRKYTGKNGLSNKYITAILEDSERNLWIGSLGGLNRLKRTQRNSLVFESLLNDSVITCLFEDSEKNLWVGTDVSGIKRLKDGKFISYAPLESRQTSFLSSVFQDRNGDIWMGTLKGQLFRCRGSQVVETLEPRELSGVCIAALGEDIEGNPWIGTNGRGVFQMKNRQKETFIQYTTNEGLSDNLVTSMYMDSQGNLWFSTYDGVSIFRYPGGTIETFTSRDGLLGKVVHNVYEDKAHNIWIAADNGITLMKSFCGGPGGSFYKKSPLAAGGKKNIKYYLKGVSVTCVYEDPSPVEGNGKYYWISTYGAGLKRLNLNEGTIISYITAEGMSGNCLYRFFEDRQGCFWIMSDSGILRISKSDLNRFARKESDTINCVSFGISDGMKSTEFNNEFSRNSALEAGNGQLWFITKKGISIVDPGKIRLNKTPPPVVIEAVAFNHQRVERRLFPGANYTFKGKQDFSANFTAPTFLSPHKIKFKYRLQGFDIEWKFLPAGLERSAYYRDLGPGTYTFKVIACNAEGVWNRDGDSITFIIEPYFYQTFLFKIIVWIMLTVILIVLFLIHKKRIFKGKAQESEQGEPEEANKDDSPGSEKLNPIFADQCIKKLTHLVIVEKVYRDEKISVKSLAKALNISSHQLSWLLNEKLKRNFPDYINYHRIEEVKIILESPTEADETITDLAHQVGFNTMSAFYKAFKKYTGMNPNQYREEKKEAEKP
ncbi:MAG: two-component regulator propeller domain-containing protein [Candidatus Aminicenantes bacterium]|jgi:ligand-binding sensor domain-containing protein/AraC-like DNA-binding protein